MGVISAMCGNKPNTFPVDFFLLKSLFIDEVIARLKPTVKVTYFESMHAVCHSGSCKK